jgi:hypothetical protein
MTPPAIAAWHQCLAQRDVRALHSLLADDVVFHSPVVHTPQVGKALTTGYLAAAFTVLGNDTFRYVREVVGPSDAVLEFEVIVDGLTVNGVDLIRWNTADQITDFKVMVRPLKAIQMVHAMMGEMLAQMTAKAS